MPIRTLARPPSAPLFRPCAMALSAAELWAASTDASRCGRACWHGYAFGSSGSRASLLDAFSSARVTRAVGGFDETLYAFEDIAISRALKRVGKFVILSETVTTSGRNLCARSGFEALRMLAGLARHGPDFFRTRRGLGLWYEGRRDDPDSTHRRAD